MSNPYDVVRQFEAALAEYTGAPYVVSTTSCTAALMLACAWEMIGKSFHVSNVFVIPRYTYVGVPMSIIHAKGYVGFKEEEWVGEYQLEPFPIWDCARWLRADMYRAGQMMCLSLHHSKHCGISTHGGAILHDNAEADAWLRRARYDGRAEGVAPKDDTGIIRGWHCYMTPPAAAEGLLRLSCLPRHNDPLPWGPGTNSDYADLSQMEIFK